MANNLNLAALDFVEKTASALQDAEQLVRTNVKDQEKAASLAGIVVDKLHNSGFLPIEQRDEALQKLASVSGTLEVLSNLLDLQTTAEKSASAHAVSNGQGHYVPSREKQAPISYDRGGYLGRRSGTKSASDQAFADALGR